MSLLGISTLSVVVSQTMYTGWEARTFQPFFRQGLSVVKVEKRWIDGICDGLVVGVVVGLWIEGQTQVSCGWIFVRTSK